ncbi:MAG TPA: FAD-binding oxidoreductase [Candidatus Krumholzibacteria bacterium]|nr:FAD-binding oxidoreductase [Candidatus Krumholzibacteria bacterium]
MKADLERLRSVFGAASVEAWQPALPALAGVLPSATPVLAPASAAEVQEGLRFAAREGLHVLPAGSMEHLHLAGSLRGVDFVLSTRRLDRILEHEKVDFTLIAEAGVTLHTLAAQAGEAGQRLAPAPWPGRAATVGGACAANRNGLGRLGRGTWRDAVLGCRVLHADGGTTKTGGKVVKNVSGYDLAKIYLGSLGSLALLCEINLRLVPMPERSAVVLARVPMERARDLLVAAERSSLRPQAFLASFGIGTNAAEDKDLELLARFEGQASVVEAQSRGCAALWGGQIAGDAEAEARWRSLMQFGTPDPGQVLLSLAGLPTAVVPALDVVRSCCGDGVAALGLHGVGTVAVQVPVELSPRLPELRDRLQAAGCTLRSFWSPVAVGQGFRPVPPAPALQAGLKSVFDPSGLLPAPPWLEMEAAR